MSQDKGVRSVLRRALSAWHVRVGPDEEKPAAVRYETAPQDRISFPLKLAYGAGAFVNNLLAAAIGGMLIVLNLGLGMNPALVGLVGALPRITDALTNPMMGYISDHTRSRWGRRRPYIFRGRHHLGARLLVDVAGPARASDTFYFWFFLVGSNVFYLAYTVFATPWVALGYELPRLPRANPAHGRAELHRAARLRGGPLVPLDYDVQAVVPGRGPGPATLALGIGVFAAVLGVLPAIFLRERFQQIALTEEEVAKAKEPGGFGRSMRDFFKGLKAALSSRPFLKLGLATFLVFNGFILVSSFQSYVIIYYVSPAIRRAGRSSPGTRARSAPSRPSG